MDDDELLMRSAQALTALGAQQPGIHPRIAAARRSTVLDELSSTVLRAWLAELDDAAAQRLRALLMAGPDVSRVAAFVERELDDHVRTAREALAGWRQVP